MLNHQPNFVFAKRRAPPIKNTIPLTTKAGPNIIIITISAMPPPNSGLGVGENNRIKNINASIPNPIIHQAAIFVFIGRGSLLSSLFHKLRIFLS